MLLLLLHYHRQGAEQSLRCSFISTSKCTEQISFRGANGSSAGRHITAFYEIVRFTAAFLKHRTDSDNSVSETVVRGGQPDGVQYYGM
jgi:hypothetical protein